MLLLTFIIVVMLNSLYKFINFPFQTVTHSKTSLSICYCNKIPIMCCITISCIHIIDKDENCCVHLFNIKCKTGTL